MPSPKTLTLIIEDYIYTRATLDIHKGKIVDEVDRVILALHEFFKYHLDAWWFYGAQEGEIGDIPGNINDTDAWIDYEYLRTSIGKSPVKQLDTGISDYDSQFPVEFLFKTDNEIYKILQSEIDEYKKEEAENIKKEEEKEDTKLKKSAYKKKIAKAARNKLTREERKALGIK